MAEARALYQAHLDVVSAAVWSRAYGEIERNTADVLNLETIDKTFRATPRAQVIGNLMAFRRAMEQIGATAYHRVCLEADFRGEDRIEGRHRTYILRGGNYAVDPYENAMVLWLRDGVWLMGDTRVSRHHLGSATFLDLQRAVRADAAAPTDTPDPETTT